MKLDGKVAIVTGSSRGIGKAIALGFAEEGADVVVAARTEVEREEMPGTIYRTAEEIQALGRRALPIKCDVTSEQSVNDLVRKTLEQFGRIDVLVNNAGIAYYFPVAETPLKRWELVLRVNLIGAFLCARAVLPAMIERRAGSIINITSRAGERRPSPTGVAYAVAKAGLDRFTWGLAVEVGRHNIAVNALKPIEIVSTEGMRFWLADTDKSKWRSPEMMVKAAIFLAAQDAGSTTGVVAYDEELCICHGL